jgi:hypothetical protein
MVGKIAALGIIAVIVVLAAALYLESAHAYGASGMLALQPTDPPQVPNGTHALIINYSSLQVHLSNANNASGWIQASGSGSVNLLELLNLSQTIGTAAVPSNASVNLVRFNVTSASITVNGTTYNVTVPSSQITAHINGGTTLGSNSSILLELSPVVASIITNTSTVFVMVPSLKGVVVAGASNSTTLNLGARVALTERHRLELEATAANISITGASLSVSSGNATSISITVRNNANRSVVLRNVALFGNESVKLNLTALRDREVQLTQAMASHMYNFCLQLNHGSGFNASNIINDTNIRMPEGENSGNYTNIKIGDMNGAMIRAGGGGASGSMMHVRPQVFAETEGNTSLGGQYNTSTDNGNLLISTRAGGGVNASGQFGAESDALDIAENAGIALNASICNNINASRITSRINNEFANMTQQFGSEQHSYRMVVFLVRGNGTMYVPSGEADFEGQGLSLGAGQSATLSFNGTIQMAQGHIVLAPVASGSYKISVQGQEGASASLNATATGT